MEKMNREQLQALRRTKRAEMTAQSTDDGMSYITIGMGTCGIAAGARAAQEAFADEIKNHNFDHICIRETGCMGLCFSEPTVEVKTPGMPPVIYGDVDEKTARRIVREHILKKALISGHIYEKPAEDIIH